MENQSRPLKQHLKVGLGNKHVNMDSRNFGEKILYPTYGLGLFQMHIFFI